MVVKTGTATPWREAYGADDREDRDTAVYLCPGSVAGPADLLAEALRADGVVRTLGVAIRKAEEAQLWLGWYGTADEWAEDVLCNEDGESDTGMWVPFPRPCVVALVDVTE